MSLPREGSRVIREGIIVAEPMDWCKSPSAIVPYKIHTVHQVEGANTADSVRQTDCVSHVKGSLIRACYGDEPGTGGGVMSGTHNAECEPKEWSSSVRAQDRNMVRDRDAWWMNHRNTWGRLAYVKDRSTYDTPEAKDVKPRMPIVPGQTPGSLTDATPDPVSAGQNYAQAVPMPVPGIGPIPPPIPQEQSKRAADALWKGMKGLAPEEGETFSEYMQRPLYNLGIKKKDTAKPKDDAVRVTRPEVKRTCSDERHDELRKIMKDLQANVLTNRYFQTNNLRWLSLVTCADAMKRIDNLKKVRDARQKIQDECYKASPEPGHDEAIEQLEVAIKKAQLVAAVVCAPQE